MRLTLQYVNSPEINNFDAWLILGLVVSVNLMRALLFNGMFIVASHSGKCTGTEYRKTSYGEKVPYSIYIGEWNRNSDCLFQEW